MRLLPAPLLPARQLPAPAPLTRALPPAPLLQAAPAQLLRAAPALIRMQLLQAPRLRILQPAPPPELTRTQPLPAAPLPLTRVLHLLTKIRMPPQLIRPRRLTRVQTRTRMQMQDRTCPRPLLRCRYSACWDSVLWLPASLAAKRNNQRSST